jgi:hypothetical protein
MCRRQGILLALFVGAIIGAAASPCRAEEATGQNSVRVFADAGIGIPEILHASFGTFLGPHVSLAARANLTLFNPMLGIEAMYSLGTPRGRRPPRSSLLLGASAMLNPTLGGLKASGQGETIAASLNPSVGYAYLGDTNFYLRVLVSVIVYHQGTSSDAHFEAGPSLTAGAGFAM